MLATSEASRGGNWPALRPPFSGPHLRCRVSRNLSPMTPPKSTFFSTLHSPFLIMNRCVCLVASLTMTSFFPYLFLTNCDEQC